MLSFKFKRVVGIDTSDSHLVKAREKCPKAEFYESLIETFETKEKFDTVTMIPISALEQLGFNTGTDVTEMLSGGFY